jgi:peptidoglycan/xylan/chitin deacetylase (PgdA/CDA1 family)
MPFIFTNDDAGTHEVGLFHELLDFLRDEGVPATFFTVPCGGGIPLGERREWVEALQRARAEGHEIALHAYVHTCFEFGRPPDFMLDLMSWESNGKRGWAELEQNGAQLQRAWQRDALRDLLRKGQAQLRDVLGIEPLSFRAPCCSTCDGLYEALADVGITYDSSQIIDWVGWEYCRKEFSKHSAWDERFPPHAFPYRSGVTEIPLMSEYTWFITPSEVDVVLRLAREDFDRAAAQPGSAFVALSHFYAMTGEHRAGLDFYRRLFDHARQHDGVRFMTLADYIRGVASG